MTYLSSSLPALADGWPAHPVRIIVPFGAGGAGDTLARVVAQHLSETLGQPFVVEDRPGAGGIVGIQQVAAAAPDGYMIGISNLSTMSLVPIINPEAKYDPLADFKHIAYIGGSPVVLAANPATGIKTFKDFVAYARAPGRSFTFSSSGVGSDGHLMGIAIAEALHLKAEHVPYKSTTEALTDVVAGQVPFSTLTLSSTSGFLQAKTLIGIAITSQDRLAEFPDLPTFKELDHPELLDNTWFAFSGPAKLPEDVVVKLNKAVSDAVSMPDVRERFAHDGFLAQPMSPRDFTNFVSAENAKWKVIIQEAGLAEKPQ
ncbi:MAG TPA: tripartite tricarboxylate transporter substrate binding protein [Xanthobacteraceae bacterium]|jgi:tripartite-type tricarboxylate transporter receptor subunit TctC|nr:tripartite tricarboxylate transporter substrate binding protein [Xanthobacteraceae bacterium]